jgi:hypothetical protein
MDMILDPNNINHKSDQRAWYNRNIGAAENAKFIQLDVTRIFIH